VTALYPVVTDINGIFRGKRLPAQSADKVFKGAMKLPASTLHVDVFGRDALDSGLVLETGDRDGTLKPTGRGPLQLTWAEDDVSLLPCQMYLHEGEISPIDPRAQLEAVVSRLRGAGLTAVCATELEFYLYDLASNGMQPPLIPGTAKRMTAGSLYSIDLLEAFKAFTDDIYTACEAWDVPADAAISESGMGQFEVNLLHTDDAVKAADDAALFKFIVRGVARKHGLGATFMAKPYGEDAGNGFHLHTSMLDQSGTNIFDNGTDLGSPALASAVAGLLRVMPDSTLFFAPHLNSFRRLREGTHAPTTASWGMDNRTAAVRIPAGPGAARRFEHRVSGADANPYLVIASVLAAALEGIEAGATPPAAFTGSSYDQDLPRLPSSWEEALARFEHSDFIEQTFGAAFRRAVVAAKRQEIGTFAEKVTPFELQSYRDEV
jgi:glutamine synthetase